MNKKVIVISVLLILICAIIISVIIFTGKDDSKVASTNPSNEMSQNVENILNNIETNVLNEMDSTNIVNETTSQNIVENVQTNNDTTQTPNNKTEVLPEEPKKAEEKAINIVKTDWGEDSSVKFQVETIDANGNYVVSVRSIETTAAMAFYTVNTTTGTFTK